MNIHIQFSISVLYMPQTCAMKQNMSYHVFLGTWKPDIPQHPPR